MGLWGVGHNSKNLQDFGKALPYNIDTSEFGLVGVRDYGRKEGWVPCVSLHTILDQPFTVENEIGVFFRKKTFSNPTATKMFFEFPSTANNEDFEVVVQFIGETNTVLTDSYHAMYWLLLLGKKSNSVPQFH